ncbi:MAG: Glycerol-3-phosphate dehydrogenase [NAD(P)+] [Elusimicrobia bacterium]|nr:Glycerol-3-phosphate dehydrogenase [NAD(P)+] [Elusimicrobiota bacterium]
MTKEKIAVLGGGSWGATLASHLSKQGHDVMIWEFMKEVAEYLTIHRSLKTLPDLRISANVQISNNIKEALQGRDVILSVTPSHVVRSTFINALAQQALQPGALVISASKGIENGSFSTMSQIISQVFPALGELVILTGPSHAEEVALGQPVALVAASTLAKARERVQDIFSSDQFRIYTSTDPLGVELGGSIKNVYAVACGIVDGLKLGDNTKAALMTRGLAEMARLGKVMGAQPVTFFGLSGLGDLIVTCGSKHSRNRSLGEKIGTGKNLKQALSEMTMVAEGVNTTESAYHLAKIKKVEMPIVNEIYKILFENKPPRDSIRDLMSRQVGAEMEGIAL